MNHRTRADGTYYAEPGDHARTVKQLIAACAVLFVLTFWVPVINAITVTVLACSLGYYTRHMKTKDDDDSDAEIVLDATVSAAASKLYNDNNDIEKAYPHLSFAYYIYGPAPNPLWRMRRFRDRRRYRSRLVAFGKRKHIRSFINDMQEMDEKGKEAAR